jgi:predicted nucleic acid-binding protein
VRTFLDANILFSAARADGAARQLLDLCVADCHELWVDAYIVAEARRNLAAKSPGSLAGLDTITSRMKIGGMLSLSSSALLSDLMVLPEKDRPVLAAAIHQQCDILVTGDRTHFGPLYGKTIRGVTVLSPAMLAEAVLGA